MVLIEFAIETLVDGAKKATNVPLTSTKEGTFGNVNVGYKYPVWVVNT
jgi:hypothetical protein